MRKCWNSSVETSPYLPALELVSLCSALIAAQVGPLGHADRGGAASKCDGVKDASAV